MIRFIDLNADMGEYTSDAQRDVEAALMPLISSCSIACGGHAGDAETMGVTVKLAKQYGVSIGGHPSYPDRVGFGRRSLSYDPVELSQSLTRQIDQLHSILATEEIPMRHVKPHGALYNDAAKDKALAEIFTNAVRKVENDTVIIGPPGSMLEAAAKAAKLTFAAEGFVDRLYQSTGALTPRSEAGAIIEDISERAHQALTISRGDTLQLSDGTLRLEVQTLCIHSDSPGAVETAKAARAALAANGIKIRAFN